MASEIAVEISDLRGWYGQVGRSGGHLLEGHNYATRNINDPDFGRIMDLIKGDYEKLLPALHDMLLAAGQNMDRAKIVLETTANDYVDVDRQIAGSLAGLDGNAGVSVIDDGVADGFGDLSAPTEHLKDPKRGDQKMPEVSFGIAWDRVCDLLVTLGASDPRETVATKLAGDIPKATGQADAWRMLAEFVGGVQGNLSSGQTSISKTWTGDASSAAAGHFRSWDTKFEQVESIMKRTSQSLDDAAKQAVDLAQVATDTFVLIVSVLVAAFTKASIPIYGQAYLAKKGWEAFKLYKNVVTVLNIFFTLLRTIKDLLVAAVGEFSRESLPKPPQA
ncbi:WXG100 family type VII secretion target [Nocardia sp. NPDC019395]|uniref:WXG100 family type VII secretion target n=1 Tax=Nocardia sp. NPDC019395 TaxID=3154686 RepID=UPI0033F89508